ncbi:THO complex subunit 5 homolog [Haliotis rufescens]|uniref:THO complex subunit 5 homolog n=1 Tax=Haliotis rufescens TaxID=6454 RepID=UPI001EB0964B|nr:THO complex subunit 5 homolog [Haliotis rufescens]
MSKELDVKDKKKKRLLKPEITSSSPDMKKTKSIDSLASKEPILFHMEEEEEVDSHDPHDDLGVFKTSCDIMRASVSDINKLKQNKEANAEELEEKRINASLQFVVLKKLNRLAHFRCRKVREGTSEAKQRIDQYHLQLQNLLYEAMHLQKEITKCLEFKSKDEEIELVSVGDFYKEAPADISKPELTKKDKHQRTLARLDWELEQRKQLASKLKEAQTQREDITQEIKTKQDHLESLQPKLQSILQATKPVQGYLGMQYDEVCEQHETAYHLPRPLYVLYMQASAYKEACDTQLKVTIEGDIDAARSLVTTATPDLDEESDSDQEEQETSKSKRRRKTVEARQTDKKAKVLRKHPLSVILDVTTRDGSSLHLTFHYLLVLQIITVNVKVNCGPDTITNSISGGDLLSLDSILNELYPGDHGKTTPNQANQYELVKQGMHEFSEYLCEVGRPYMWAQWLGGLQFLGDNGLEKAKSSVSASYMQQTIKKLRRRIKSRLSLLQQLASLERNSIPVSSDVLKNFPAKILSHVTSWQRSTFEDFASLPYTRSAISTDMARETDMFFTLTMERGSAKLTSQVIITPDYPAVAPMFVVNITWQTDRNAGNDIHVKELEEEVNIHYEELVGRKSQGQLLSNQLQRLLMCFDVYLETESHDVSSPVEIPKEKVFPRTARGPNRKKPYRYMPDLSIFIQR